MVYDGIIYGDDLELPVIGWTLLDSVSVQEARDFAKAEGYDCNVLWFMHSIDENGYDKSFQNVIENILTMIFFINYHQCKIILI